MKYVITHRGSMLTWSTRHGWTPDYGTHLSELEGKILIAKMNNPLLYLDKVSTGQRIG